MNTARPRSEAPTLGLPRLWIRLSYSEHSSSGPLFYVKLFWEFFTQNRTQADGSILESRLYLLRVQVYDAGQRVHQQLRKAHSKAAS